jgi:hypothetical protein
MIRGTNNGQIIRWSSSQWVRAKILKALRMSTNNNASLGEKHV